MISVANSSILKSCFSSLLIAKVQLWTSVARCVDATLHGVMLSEEQSNVKIKVTITALYSREGAPSGRVFSGPATASRRARRTLCRFSYASSWACRRRRFCSGMCWWTERCKPRRPSWWPRRSEGGRQGRGPPRSHLVRPWSEGEEMCRRQQQQQNVGNYCMFFVKHSMDKWRWTVEVDRRPPALWSLSLPAITLGRTATLTFSAYWGISTDPLINSLPQKAAPGHTDTKFIK